MHDVSLEQRKLCDSTAFVLAPARGGPPVGVAAHVVGQPTGRYLGQRIALHRIASHRTGCLEKDGRTYVGNLACNFPCLSSFS